MRQLSSQNGGRLTGSLIALTGLAFSLLMALGPAERLCVTGGCALHQNAGFLGLSFWWWGAVAFTAVGTLTVLGRTREAFRLSLVLVALDVLFLLWMALTATCVSCTVAGLLLALLLPAIRPLSLKGRTAMLLLLTAWGLVFTPNLFSAVRELTTPWAVASARQPTVQVFFSPTCGTCQTVLFDMLRDGWAAQAAFYPLAKNEEDVARIAVLRRDLAANATLGQAFEHLLDEDTPQNPPSAGLGLRWALYRNQLTLLRHGTRSVPLVLIQGRAPRPAATKD